MKENSEKCVVFKTQTYLHIDNDLNTFEKQVPVNFSVTQSVIKISLIID